MNRNKKPVTYASVANYKTVVTVAITLSTLIGLAGVFVLIWSLVGFQWTAAVIGALVTTVSYWFISNALSRYELQKSELKAHEMNHTIGDLLNILSAVKEANGRGVMIQDLERKGLLKLEIYRPPHEERSKEQIETDNYLLSRLKKKERSIN